MTTSRNHNRRGRKLATALALASVATTVSAGLGVGTSSANEFEPKPTAEIAVSCVGSPHVAITLGDVHGLANADFVVNIDDAANLDFFTDSQSIVPGASQTFSYPVHEGEHYVVHVVSEQQEIATLEADIDCSPPLQAGISLTCASYMDILAYRFENTEQVSHDVTFHYPPSAVVPDRHETVAAGQTLEDAVKADEDVAVTDGEATIVVDGVELASYTGTADCTDPGATITLACPADGDPQLVWHLSNGGPTFIGIASTLDGKLLVNASLQNETEIRTETIAEGATFDAKAISSDQVVLAELAGVVDCDQPDGPDVPEVPVPGPVVETVVVPAVPVNVAVVPAVATPAAPVAVQPHFTG